MGRKRKSKLPCCCSCGEPVVATSPTCFFTNCPPLCALDGKVLQTLLLKERQRGSAQLIVRAAEWEVVPVLGALGTTATEWRHGVGGAAAVVAAAPMGA
jgi:hypothetical protein